MTKNTGKILIVDDNEDLLLAAFLEGGEDVVLA